MLRTGSKARSITTSYCVYFISPRPPALVFSCSCPLGSRARRHIRLCSCLLAASLRMLFPRLSLVECVGSFIGFLQVRSDRTSFTEYVHFVLFVLSFLLFSPSIRVLPFPFLFPFLFLQRCIGQCDPRPKNKMRVKCERCRNMQKNAKMQMHANVSEKANIPKEKATLWQYSEERKSKEIIRPHSVCSPLSPYHRQNDHPCTTFVVSLVTTKQKRPKRSSRSPGWQARQAFQGRQCRRHGDGATIERCLSAHPLLIFCLHGLFSYRDPVRATATGHRHGHRHRQTQVLHFATGAIVLMYAPAV